MKTYLTLLLLAVSAYAFSQRPEPDPEACFASPTIYCGQGCEYTCGQTCSAISPIGGSVNCYSNAYVAYCNAYNRYGTLVVQQQAGGTLCAACCN